MAFRIWAFALLIFFAPALIDSVSIDNGVFGISFDAAAHGDEPSMFESRDGVLVLRNGFVLHGRITPQSESYLVTFDGKGEARLPRTEVEFECRNLDEAYLIKRDSLPSDEVKIHVALADWCLRHGLLNRAADQLLLIQQQDASHPMLVGLEHRLETLHGAARQIQESSYVATPESPVDAIPAAGNASSVATPVSAQEIEPMMMQQFTMTIQPILLNRCGILSCHGAAGKSSYRLLRPALGHAPTSRLTHRNLQATLSYVNRDNPDDSRLLTLAKEPHGGITSVVFHEKTGNQLDLLTAWVRRLDGSAPATPSEKPSAIASKPATIPAVLSEKAAAMQRLPALGDVPQTSDSELPATTPADSNRKPPSKTRPGDSEGGSDFTPRDPFDPEVFNRQFHKTSR